MQIPKYLIIFSSLGHMLGFIFGGLDHPFDASWASHARFHVVLGLFWVAGLDLIAIIIATGPLARAEPWSCRVLLVNLVLNHLAYFGAILIVPEGQPVELYKNILFAVNVCIYAAGLGLGWRHLSSARCGMM
ncbi:MAG: hypothetical protein O6945_16240 [Gammaproteobacteria bacterium]|nr:hypothetical protein [Gammaproteobacteria bacterium]